MVKRSEFQAQTVQGRRLR